MYLLENTLRFVFRMIITASTQIQIPTHAYICKPIYTVYFSLHINDT
jgi:hypothetical protein